MGWDLLTLSLPGPKASRVTKACYFAPLNCWSFSCRRTVGRTERASLCGFRQDSNLEHFHHINSSAFHPSSAWSSINSAGSGCPLPAAQGEIWGQVAVTVTGSSTSSSSKRYHRHHPNPSRCLWFDFCTRHMLGNRCLISVLYFPR